MLDFTPDGIGAPVSVSCERGLLHGELALLPQSPGIVVLVHAALALDARDGVLARQFRHAGLSTLSVDLLTHPEEHFPDASANVPQLAHRLIAFLGLLRHRMLLGELREQPIGLFAANATSPVAIRVAALRDHDIAALVCRGGLIDLAGVQYLHALESPLLLLSETENDPHIASNRRALQEIRCRNAHRIIPEIGIDYAASAGIVVCLHDAAEWFLSSFPEAPANRQGPP